MLKALYLQALSDAGLEEALLHRLSFRQFCGFALEARTPDETTICRFRAAAAAAGLAPAAFAEVASQLEVQGLMLKTGTLMDATLVDAAHAPPSFRAGPGASHPREPEAEWTRKDSKTRFGYKLHIGLEAGSDLVRRAEVTGAKTNESKPAPDADPGSRTR